jgi:hypothetical protein
MPRDLNVLAHKTLQIAIGESCIFQAVPQPDRIAGAYICLNGAAIMERGRWDLQRAY